MMGLGATCHQVKDKGTIYYSPGKNPEELKKVLTPVRFESFNSFFLKEASFSSNATSKVASLLARLLEKNLSIKLYPFGGENFSQQFTKSDGTTGSGFLYFIGDKFPQKAVRINFENTKEKSSGVTSLDYWSDFKYNAPSYSVKLPASMNAVSLVKTLTQILEKPAIGSIEITENIHYDELTETPMVILKEARKVVPVPEFLRLCAELNGKKERYTGKEIIAVQNKYDVMVPSNVWNDRSKDSVYPVIEQPKVVEKEVEKPKEVEPRVKAESEEETGSHSDGYDAALVDALVMVVKGQSEKIIPGQSEQNVIKMGSVDELFQDLENLTRTVVEGTIPSLVVSGPAGSGKSTVVMNVIKESGLKEGDRNFLSIHGSVTEASFYQNLFYYRAGLVLMDDSDGLFDSKLGLNILKAALDSNSIRKISWLSKATKNVSGMTKQARLAYFNLLDAEFFGDNSNGTSLENDDEENSTEKTNELDDDLKLPSEFEFKGKIIFITNLSKDELIKKGMSAVLSRSLFIELKLEAKEIFERIKSILPKIVLTDGEGKAHAIHSVAKEEVYNFLVKEYRGGRLPNISIRTYVNMLKVRASGNPNWTKFLKYTNV